MRVASLKDLLLSSLVIAHRYSERYLRSMSLAIDRLFLRSLKIALSGIPIFDLYCNINMNLDFTWHSMSYKEVLEHFGNPHLGQNSKDIPKQYSAFLLSLLSF